MNNTKRALQLASGITSIVVSSIVSIIMLIGLASIELVAEVMKQMDGMESYPIDFLVSIVTIIYVIFILLNIAIIVIGSLLCPKPIKNGVIKNKTGLVITLLILNGINLLICIDFILFVLAILSILTMLIISLALKHNSTVVFANNILTTSSINVAEQLSDDVISEDVETIKQEDQTSSNNEAKIVANDEIDSIEHKLIQLKELKNNGAINEEQYKEAVSNLFKNL